MSDDRPRLKAIQSGGLKDSSANVPSDVLRLVSLPQERRSMLLQVSELVDQIAFGTVVIVMHEGKVTQIETSEKLRLR